MFNNKELNTKYSDILEFSNTLKNFVLANNQININETLINIYNNYDSNLRIICKDLIKCGEVAKNNSTMQKECIKSFVIECEKLKSQTSKQIEKEMIEK